MGRAEAPPIGGEGAQFLSAGGDNTEALHGPLYGLFAGSSIAARPLIGGLLRGRQGAGGANTERARIIFACGGP